MRKGLYSKLAWNSIRSNRRTYIPYILTSVVMVMMFFIVDSLSHNSGLDDMFGRDTVTAMLSMGVWITGLFAVIFLFYTNSFLMKRRKKELGLYNILGMEKRHIARMIMCETLYLLIISLALGLGLGALLNRLMFLVILNVLRTDIPLQFEWSATPFVVTVCLFVALFVIIGVNNLRQIHVSKPIELLKGGQVGEREPKAKWLLAIIGLFCLGTGYYMALVTENPIAALELFFVAVLLVIAGTYCLFLSGSIALLKLLRKSKRYYYHPRHFTSVSGMIYRMKQNATGLANICILSTAVLVMVSSTLSLYLGMEDIMQTRYPRDVMISFSEKDNISSRQMHQWVNTALASPQLTPENEMEYTYLAFGALQKDDFFETNRNEALPDMNNLYNLVFLSLESYIHSTGEAITLQDNQVLVYANRGSYDYPLLRVFDKTYTVQQQLDHFMGNGLVDSNIVSTYFVVVPTLEDIQYLHQKQQQVYGDMASVIKTYYAFDLPTDENTVLNTYHQLSKTNTAWNVECRIYERQSFLGLFGGLFFIGIFLGVLFVMATILIIYYKQISEGYDDRERFAIMQKVGMSRQEIRRTIHAQVLLVFFMPLIVAGMHMAFAFPFVTRILALFNLTNTTIFSLCTTGCFVVFGLLYVLVYAITARSYYQIVSEANKQ